jgi:hypothetical protein
MTPIDRTAISLFHAIRATGSAGARDFGIERDRTRTPDQEPLHFVAAFAGQRPELVVGLDTLGKHRQSQPMRKPDHGAHDRERAIGAAEACDERAVDLDPVEWQRLQIGQRGVSGAEIVQRDADTQNLQRIEDRGGARDVLDQYPLGNFQFEPGRRDSAFVQNGSDQMLQIAPAELDRRDVDGDLQRIVP